jgi:diacylglycerol kinase (ATP)
MGGDGTLHEVVNGILRGRPHGPPPLAVVPVGTANIFARALGLPTDPLAAARLLLQGSRRRIDVGQANDRYFATIAGAGFDAAVVRAARQLPRWIEGKRRHVAAGLAALATYHPVETRLWIDGQPQTTPLFLLAAANTDWYGGGVHIAPHARVDDGRLSLVYCGAVGRLEAVGLALQTFSGRHLQHQKVKHTHAIEIRVDSELPLPVHADGEDIGSTPAIFRCIPQAIEVFVSAVPA